MKTEKDENSLQDELDNLDISDIDTEEEEDQTSEEESSTVNENQEDDVTDNTAEDIGTEEDEEEEDEEEGEEETITEIDSSGDDELSQNDALIAEINRLQGIIGEVTPASSEESNEEDEISDSFDFVGNLDMDDVSANPQIMNQLLEKVSEAAEKRALQRMMLNIPEIIMAQIKQQTAFKRTADQFYEDNPDLVNVRNVVKACANQIVAEKPEWQLEEVFKETATRTRKMLGIKKQAETAALEDVPSLEHAAVVNKSKGSQSRRGLKTKLSALQQELDEL